MFGGKRLGLIANFLWGTSFLASGIAVKSFGPFLATELRFLFAIFLMIILFPILNIRIQKPRSLSEWGLLSLISFVGFGLLYPAQLEGLRYISSSFSASIMLTSPLFVLILGFFFLKEKVTLSKAIAVAGGIIGGIVLIGEKDIVSFELISQQKIGGILITLLASLSLACSVILTKKFSIRLKSSDITFWSMAIGATMLIPFAISELNTYNWSTAKPIDAILSTIYLSSVCSVLCFFIWNKAIAEVPAIELASSMHLKTPVAIFLGAAVAREGISLNLLIGVFITTISIWVSQVELFEKKTREGVA